jgi:hypothetical protein
MESLRDEGLSFGTFQREGSACIGPWLLSPVSREQRGGTNGWQQVLV